MRKELKKVIEKIEKQTIAEVKVKVEAIRKEKKVKKIKAKQEAENKPKVEIILGDKVRMIDGKATGIVEKIDKKTVTVNYGLFISKASMEQLEFVERPKK